MNSITIFQPLIDEQSKSSEKDKIQWLIDAPTLGSVVSIGGDRQWEVFAVETYRDEAYNVYLAHIHPQGEPLPSPAIGTIQALQRFSPSLAFYVQLSPGGDILGSGWRMNGDAPIGRLFTHGGPRAENEDRIRFENVDLPWIVDSIDSYQPVGTGSFSRIHICDCLPIEHEQLAIA